MKDIWQTSRDEAGAVIIFVAMTVVVMITFAILVIDGGIVANSREQAEYGARMACLAALEGHIQSTATTLNAKVAAALRRARAASKTHTMLSTAELSDPESRSDIDGPETGDPSSVAILTPGRYFWDKERITGNINDGLPLPPKAAPDCAAATGRDNCFEPWKPRFPGDPTTVDFTQVWPVSAYSVEGSFYKGIKYRLATFLGAEKSVSNVKAICALIPRHLSFAVDLSPSIKNDTHKKRNWEEQRDTPEANGRGSEFAFFLKADNPLIPSAPTYPRVQNVWDWINGSYPAGTTINGVSSVPCNAAALDAANTDPASSLGKSAKTFCGNYCRSNSNVPAICPAVATGARNSFNPADATYGSGDKLRNTIHYRDDYVKIKTLGDGDFTANPKFAKFHPNPNDPVFKALAGNVPLNRGPGHWYRVDQFPGNGGPQPLTSTLLGVKNAIEAFNMRRVAGDKVSAIFYDTELTWPRIFLPSTDFSYLLGALDFTNGMGSFGTTEPLDDPNNDSVLDVPAAQFTSDSKPGFVRAMRHQLFPGVTTDGRTIFTNTGAALSLASGMMKRAQSTGAPSQDAIILITDGLNNCTAGPPAACSNDYSSYKTAYSNLFTKIVPNFIGANVSIHTILLGRDVAPHTVLRPDPLNPGSCLTEEASRASANTLPFVLGGIRNGFGAACGSITDCTTYGAVESEANAINHFRNADDNNPFYQANVDAYAVSQATQGLWIPIRPPLTGCPLNLPCTGQPVRLEYDPGCRDEKAQIADGIAKIVGANPFMIVEVQ